MNNKQEKEAFQQIMAAQERRAPAGIMERSNALREEYCQARSEGRLTEWMQARKATRRAQAKHNTTLETIQKQISEIERNLVLLEADMVIYELKVRG